MTLRIEYMALSALLRHPRNPKEHDLPGIAGSINRFGFVEPPVIDERTGYLTAGHGRLETLQNSRLSGDHPPKNVEARADDWYMPVVRGHEFNSDEEVLAYLVASNRLTEKGGWNDQVLADLLTELRGYDHALMLDTGFNDEDLNRLLADLPTVDLVDVAEPTRQSPSEGVDLAAEAQAKWQVQPGDLWLIPSKHGRAEHRLMCGSCREPEEVKRLIDRTIQGAFTSPPYAERRKEQYGGIPVMHYVDWFDAVQEQVRAHIAPDGSFFVNIKPHVEDGERTLYVFDLVLSMQRQWAWKYIDEFSWLRIGAPGSWSNRFKNGFEPVYHFAVSTDCKFRPRFVVNDSHGFNEGGQNANTGSHYNTAGEIEWHGALPSNALELKQNAAGHGHPAAFPVELPAFFIRGYSDVGDTWYDPFSGSGTTMVAAEALGRIGYGMELKPEYVAITLERFAAMGLEPRRAT